ncbi:MAG: dienelactone hydrolase [Rhodospirillales bacterium]
MRFLLALVALLSHPLGPLLAAGIQPLSVPSPGGALEGALWYPCDAPDTTVKVGRLEIAGVKDCPMTGQDLPLIVISHGAGGWFAGHHDTAAALADAGYLVAAITHPDREGRAWRWERPEAVTRVIDYLLNDWPERARLDRDSIGFFGFSRGGYTGLVLAGGKPDFGRFVTHCRAVPDDLLCRLTEATRNRGTTGQKPKVSADARIKAAVIAAPLGLVFSPEGLRDVTLPLQLWRPERDVVASHPYNAEAVYSGLATKPDYRVVANAGHFAIMAPCSAAQAKAVPRICADPPGFDRAAFHQEFNAAVTTFFDDQFR